MAEKLMTTVFVPNVIAIAQFCFSGHIYTIARAAAYLIYTGNQKNVKTNTDSVAGVTDKLGAFFALDICSTPNSWHVKASGVGKEK